MKVEELLDYLENVGALLLNGAGDDLLLQFEMLMAIRDLLREIEVVQRNTKKNEEIKQTVKERLDYGALFSSISGCCITVITHFKSPTQIWKCINLIGVLIEGWNPNEVDDQGI